MNFARSSRHIAGSFDGSSADFCGFALAICRQVEATHHQLGPVSIELAGDTAFTETYFTSHHRFGAVPPAGRTPHEDRFMGGRYVDRFEKRQGEWRIAHRVCVNEKAGLFVENRLPEEAEKMLHKSGPNRRDKRDVSYVRPLTRERAIAEG